MAFLIYTKKITNRCKYIFELIFKNQLGVDFNFITNFQEFETIDGQKLNYSNTHIPKVPFISSSELLYERNIEKQKLKVGTFKEHKVLFTHSNEESDLPFDIFAASFYLISRYEEYLPNSKKDKFGRFVAKESIAYKENFLDKPLVNYWVNMLKNVLMSYFPKLKIKTPNYRFTPTFDIDIAFSYKHKGILRNIGGMFSDLYNFKFNYVSKRLNVLLRRKNDPYDTYEYILKKLKPIENYPFFFFLVGDYGLYDKNIPWQNLAYKSLIKSVADDAIVGLHPSYESNSDVALLKKEHHRLEEIIKRDIQYSRQHYLKFEWPNTFQQLVEMDFSREFSMGYADNCGFRASFSHNFFFYNLVLDIKTPLRIHPFMLMDATLKNYEKLTTSQAIKRSEEIIDTVKSVNGELVTIWHNSSLGETDGWDGWREVFEYQLKKGLED